MDKYFKLNLILSFLIQNIKTINKLKIKLLKLKTNFNSAYLCKIIKVAFNIFDKITL
jgi:hypothetical protein